MSQDLWNEFGEDSQFNPWAQHVPYVASQSSGHVKDSEMQEEGSFVSRGLDDEFGDFEVPERSPPMEDTGSSQRYRPSSVLTQSRPQDSFVNSTKAPFTSTKRPDSQGSAHASAKAANQSASTSSLHILKSSKTLKEKPSKLEERNGSHLEANTASQDAEEWDDFLSNAKANLGPQGEAASTSVHGLNFLSVPPGLPETSLPAPSSTARPSAKLLVVPSNVPPPLILISYLSSILQTLPGQLRELGERSAGNSISPEDVQKAVQNHVAITRVAAHIIAGRKLRWKRDIRLSQNMRIGPAQGGNKGGMKLMGVDKAESLREDREVAEFLLIWGQNAGRIRSVLAIVMGQVAGHSPTLPDITDKLPILGSKTDGSMLDGKYCVLCGLKRNERVNKVDMEVWDNFEEWWIELWGHTECRAFWEAHETVLRQR
ncbi:MAG: hypothetical protein MMC33_009440 [Icmadophila ericetorum]|nr:hypothetical protein [Icmadophila ericetorum]